MTITLEKMIDFLLSGMFEPLTVEELSSITIIDINLTARTEVFSEEMSAMHGMLFTAARFLFEPTSRFRQIDQWPYWIRAAFLVRWPFWMRGLVRPL